MCSPIKFSDSSGDISSNPLQRVIYGSVPSDRIAVYSLARYNNNEDIKDCPRTGL